MAADLRTLAAGPLRGDQYQNDGSDSEKSPLITGEGKAPGAFPRSVLSPPFDFPRHPFSRGPGTTFCGIPSFHIPAAGFRFPFPGYPLGLGWKSRKNRVKFHKFF
jgi:hypothetical protein